MAHFKSLSLAAAMVAALGACTSANDDRGVSAVVDCTQPGITCHGAQREVVVRGDYQVLATPVTPKAAPAVAYNPCAYNPCGPRAAPTRRSAPAPVQRPAVKPSSACSVDGCGRMIAAHVVNPQYGQMVPLSTCGLTGDCGSTARQNYAVMQMKDNPSSVTLKWVPKPGYDPAACKAKGGVTKLNDEGWPTCSLTRKLVGSNDPKPQVVPVPGIR